MGVYGMAAHIAADIFAHSAYALQGVDSSYTRITHSTEYTPGHKAADYTAYFPNRFECARELVGKVARKYYTTPSYVRAPGSYGDFMLSQYDGSFKLRYITIYMKNAGGASIYEANHTYFLSINTDNSL